MALIRIFKTLEEAENAKKVLEEGGFKVYISEDKFNKVPIQEFGVQARFRVEIADELFYKAAAFLARKLSKTRLKQ